MTPPRSPIPILPSSSGPATDADLALEAGAAERLAPPLRPWRRRPWAWGAALALHLAVLLFILLFVRVVPMQEQDSAPGVAVVFDNGGETQTAAPPAPLKGMQEATAAAQPPPPPPPPPSADTQPEVNLNMPSMPMGELPSMAQQAPQARAQPRAVPARPAPPHPSQRYVMMNGMSFGQANPLPPQPHAQPALNTSLPESNAEAVNAPELTIKGEIGADWKAALNRWVNEHKYYPDAAAEQGQQGEVTIEFTVDRDGNVTALRMLSGSGSPFLDQAWFGLFANNTLPPFPPGTKSNTLDITATMHFELIP